MRDPASRYYEIHRHDAEHYRDLIDRFGHGRVLEVGCGQATQAYELARNGATVTSIDLSDVAIQQGTEGAEQAGLSDRCDFKVMNAEDLDFPDASFDLICGTGILHHLYLDRAFAEIARTMKPDGHAVFVEPLGHNPVINAYRRLTPKYRTPDEHPLVVGDLDLAARYFGQVDAAYYHLLTMLAIPIRGRRGFDGLLNALHRADRGLFHVPSLRKHAWTVTLTLADPKANATRVDGAA